MKLLNHIIESSLSHPIDISDSKYIFYQNLGFIPIEWRLRLSLTDPVTEETVSLLSVLRDCHHPGRGLVIRVSSEVEVELSVVRENAEYKDISSISAS